MPTALSATAVVLRCVARPMGALSFRSTCGCRRGSEAVPCMHAAPCHRAGAGCNRSAWCSAATRRRRRRYVHTCTCTHGTHAHARVRVAVQAMRRSGAAEASAVGSERPDAKPPAPLPPAPPESPPSPPMTPIPSPMPPPMLPAPRLLASERPDAPCTWRALGPDGMHTWSPCTWHTRHDAWTAMTPADAACTVHPRPAHTRSRRVRGRHHVRDPRTMRLHRASTPPTR